MMLRSRVLPRMLRAVPSARVRTSFGRAAQQPPQQSPAPSPLTHHAATVVPWLIAANCAVFGLWDVRPLREWMYGNFALSLESMRSGRYHTMRTACNRTRACRCAGGELTRWRTARVSDELLQPRAPRAPRQQHAQ